MMKSGNLLSKKTNVFNKSLQSNKTLNEKSPQPPPKLGLFAALNKQLADAKKQEHLASESSGLKQFFNPNGGNENTVPII